MSASPVGFYIHRPGFHRALSYVTSLTYMATGFLIRDNTFIDLYDGTTVIATIEIKDEDVRKSFIRSLDL